MLKITDLENNIVILHKPENYVYASWVDSAAQKNEFRVKSFIIKKKPEHAIITYFSAVPPTKRSIKDIDTVKAYLKNNLVPIEEEISNKKWLIYGLAFVFIIGLFYSCGRNNTKNVTNVDNEDIFKANCPTIYKNYGKFSSVTVSKVSSSDKEYEYAGIKSDLSTNEAYVDKILPFIPHDIGWHEAIKLETNLKSDETIYLPESNMLGGNHCEFYAGGGLKPGIFTWKKSCAQLCDAKERNDENYFIDKPDLQYIESAEASKSRTENWVKSNNKDFEILNKAALSGDYQAQRNLAYSYRSAYFSPMPNYLQACSWRKIILSSKSPKIDESDKENMRFECKHLSQDESALLNETIANIKEKMKK